MKKTLAVLSVLFCLCLLCTGCAKWWKLFPHDTSEPEDSTVLSPVTFTVGSCKASIGDTLIIPVTYKGDLPLVNTDLYLSFNSECLELVKQYDTDKDTYSWIEEGNWDGITKSELIHSGTLKVLLATGKNGITEGTLFKVMFKVKKTTASYLNHVDNGALSLQVPVCNLGGTDNDIDAISSNLIQIEAGLITTDMEEVSVGFDSESSNESN